MPYAKLDVDLRLELEEIPARHRSDCAALYLASVLYSAEMLVDGRVDKAVAMTLARNLGHRNVASTAHQLCVSGLWKSTPNGYLIVRWNDHHSSRNEVKQQRERDAKRKREQRGSPQLRLTDPNVHPNVQAGHEPNVQPDIKADKTADSRAHARPRSASKTYTPLPPISQNGQVNCPECGPIQLPVGVTLDQHRTNVHDTNPDYDGPEP